VVSDNCRRNRPVTQSMTKINSSHPPLTMVRRTVHKVSRTSRTPTPRSAFFQTCPQALWLLDSDGRERPTRTRRKRWRNCCLRSVMFAVDDIDATVAGLRARGAELVGEVAQYQDSYRLCYVRGTEGIIVALAEQLS
jgi:hypothetical protein